MQQGPVYYKHQRADGSCCQAFISVCFQNTVTASHTRVHFAELTAAEQSSEAQAAPKPRKWTVLWSLRQSRDLWSASIEGWEAQLWRQKVTREQWLKLLAPCNILCWSLVLNVWTGRWPGTLKSTWLSLWSCNSWSGPPSYPHRLFVFKEEKYLVRCRQNIVVKITHLWRLQAAVDQG